MLTAHSASISTPVGPTVYRCCASYVVFGWAIAAGKLQRYVRDGQRMAQRDQITGFFGRLNASNTRNAQYIAFFGAARGDQRQRGCLHHNATRGHCHPFSGWLACYVDHVRVARRVKMGQRVGCIVLQNTVLKILRRAEAKPFEYGVIIS